MFYYPLLLLSVSLLQTASATVYYVVPDDHYTTNNNTYTLQHYLNNINKYFTSHTQLHFLPGQYYLNTDLIIQNVSNLSLIGNRTNEVINSVIKCTSPAGIVVVGSSNIVVANIVMNECSSNFNHSVMRKQLFTNKPQCRLSLLVLYSLSVKCNYLHSKWQHNPSGIKFVNGFGNTMLLNVVSTYLTVRHDNMTNNATLTTHKIRIENFKAYNKVNCTYAIDIQQSYSYCDVTVTLVNTKFRNELAVLIRHIDSLGQTIVTVANCSFSSSKDDKPVPEHCPSQHDDDDYNTCDFRDGCNDYIDQSDAIVFYNTVMIYSYFVNYNKHTKTNKLIFINCSFSNINKSDLRKLLDFSQMFGYSSVEYLVIFIIDCIFHNIYYVKLISIVSYNQQFRKLYVSVLIKNVIVSYNTNGFMDVITATNVELFIENVKFTLNIFNDLNSDIGTIITAISSYVQFSSYIEFSYNNAFLAISTSLLHIQENTVLNFTLNKFYTIIHTDESATDDINMCVIQYVSERGNLDNEFQQGQKLNYSIAFIENTVQSTTLLLYHLAHCAWDSSSAFKSSIPLQVNQRFITTDNFIVKERKKQVCLCDKNEMHYCHKGKIGPYFPGQSVSFYFSLDNDIIADAAYIEIRRGHSSFICGNVN